MVTVEVKWLFYLWHTVTGCTLQILKKILCQLHRLLAREDEVERAWRAETNFNKGPMGTWNGAGALPFPGASSPSQLRAVVTSSPYWAAETCVPTELSSTAVRSYQRVRRGLLKTATRKGSVALGKCGSIMCTDGRGGGHLTALRGHNMGRTVLTPTLLCLQQLDLNVGFVKLCLELRHSLRHLQVLFL
jgi:hypothetical protein